MVRKQQVAGWQTVNDGGISAKIGPNPRDLLAFSTDSSPTFPARSISERSLPVTKPAVKAAAPKRAAAQKTYTMRHLWRMALWGGTAASALLLAVLTTRSEVGSERIATAMSSWGGNSAARQVAARPFDPQAENRKLNAAVHDLAMENEELRSRLALVENNINDITGSVSRIEADKVQSPPNTPPGELAPVIAAPSGQPSTTAAPLAEPVPLPVPAPPRTNTASLPTILPSAPAEPLSADAGGPAAGTEYGVDIGSALSIQVLRARWLGIKSAHLQLFAGLTPTAMLRQIPHSDHVELRLIVGPLADADAASRLCAALAPFRLYCQPAVFDHNNVAIK